MGARAGYSVLNGAFFTVVCLTGLMAHVVWAVPVDAGMAIVLWIGIVITAQAFVATPRSHAPAVVVGLLPGIAAWGTLLMKTSLRVAGYGSPGGPRFDEAMVAAFQREDVWLAGAFALESGFIFTAMILAAVTVCIIEQRFRQAAVWSLVAAAVSCTGLMHGYAFTPGDAVLRMALQAPWQNPWALGYLILAALLYLARWITLPASADGH
jgi:AGZA family xanthine/uracil permease-like MFS transporter